MRIRIDFDPRCVFEVGERTPDRRALILAGVRAITALLREHRGLPPGPRREVNDVGPYFVWEDRNWRVSYTITTDVRGWFYRTARTIRVIAVRLAAGN